MNSPLLELQSNEGSGPVAGEGQRRPSGRGSDSSSADVISSRLISADEGLVAAEIDGLGDVFTLEYRFPFAVETPNADALIAACLVAGMKSGRSLFIDGEISPSLAASSVTVQEILSGWFSDLQMIKVDALSVQESQSGEGKVGCFFTGGVDSFYSVLKHREEIDELVFVHGFDFSLEAIELRSTISNALRSAADDLGIPLIEVECNLREFSDRFAYWIIYHGSALASVALATGRYRKMFVPSTRPYEALEPLGSHPLLDPLWSTQRIEMVHDGAEANRLDKIARLSAHDIPLKWLRVCWENHDNRYNCGRCEKCLRTMISLELAGALPRARTFPTTMRYRDVARMPITVRQASYLRENLRAARRREHRILALVLRGVILRLRVQPVLERGVLLRRKVRNLLGKVKRTVIKGFRFTQV